MSLTEPPTCPACHQMVALTTLRQRMSGNFFVPGNRVGVICDKCGAQLRVDRRRAFVLVACAWVGALAVLYYVAIVRALPRGLEQIAWSLGAGLVLALGYRLGAYHLKLQKTDPSEQLFVYEDSFNTPETLAQQAVGRAALAEERAAAVTMLEPERMCEINDPARRPWRCHHCDSENPATFDLCWNCEQSRPER